MCLGSARSRRGLTLLWLPELLFLEGNEGITGDLGDLFCDNPIYVEDKPLIIADCELCVQYEDCCALCCRDGEACNPGTFVPDLDPIWQFNFQRVYTNLFQDEQFDEELESDTPTNDTNSTRRL